MPRTRSFPYLIASLLAVLTVLLALAAADRLLASAATPTPNPLFTADLPSNGDAPVTLRLAADDLAMVSIASVRNDVPRAVWLQAGWHLGAEIGPNDDIPPDCLLHARQGIAHQVYARCSGNRTLVIPNTGGDFIYVAICRHSDCAKAQLLRMGKQYDPDTTGLIP